MLVLARRVNESITIGDDIVVTVLAVEGDRVKLGIQAPRDLLILRQEIFDAVQSQTRLQEHLNSAPAPESFNQLRDLLNSEQEDLPPDNG